MEAEFDANDAAGVLIPPKKKVGRPKKIEKLGRAPTLSRTVLQPPSPEPGSDYAHADIDTIVSRQISMLDWAQQAARNEMRRAYQGRGLSIKIEDIERLATLSNAILRTIEALKKSSDLAEELAKRLSPEQLFRAAVDKIKSQDRATLKKVIKELRGYYHRASVLSAAVTSERASTAVASLEDDE